MAGLLVSYTESVEGVFSEVAEGEHFYHQGYLMMREAVDGTNTLQYLGDVERNRITLQDDASVRILKDCRVRVDDGSEPVVSEPFPVVEEIPVVEDGGEVPQDPVDSGG